MKLTNLSEWRVFDLRGVDHGCMCVHNHQLTVLDGQSCWVLLLLDICILTSDHVHHSLLQLLHIKWTVCVCVCACVHEREREREREYVCMYSHVSVWCTLLFVCMQYPPS